MAEALLLPSNLAENSVMARPNPDPQKWGDSVKQSSCLAELTQYKFTIFFALFEVETVGQLLTIHLLFCW